MCFESFFAFGIGLKNGPWPEMRLAKEFENSDLTWVSRKRLNGFEDRLVVWNIPGNKGRSLVDYVERIIYSRNGNRVILSKNGCGHYNGCAEQLDNVSRDLHPDT